MVVEDRRYSVSICYYLSIFRGGSLLRNKPKRRCSEGLLGAQLLFFSDVLAQTFAI